MLIATLLKCLYIFTKAKLIIILIFTVTCLNSVLWWCLIGMSKCMSNKNIHLYTPANFRLLDGFEFLKYVAENLDTIQCCWNEWTAEWSTHEYESSYTIMQDYALQVHSLMFNYRQTKHLGISQMLKALSHRKVVKTYLWTLMTFLFTDSFNNRLWSYSVW